MAGPGFVHLHVHSGFSLLEGALPLGRLLDLAKADKQPALGVADTNNLFGALEFSEKAAGKGIQPLIGTELGPVHRYFKPPNSTGGGSCGGSSCSSSSCGGGGGCGGGCGGCGS